MQRIRIKLQQHKSKQRCSTKANCSKVCASAVKAKSVFSSKPLVQRGHRQLESWTNVVKFLFKSPSQDAFNLAYNCQHRACRPKLPPNDTRSQATTQKKAVECFNERERTAADTSGKACLGRSLDDHHKIASPASPLDPTRRKDVTS